MFQFTTAALFYRTDPPGCLRNNCLFLTTVPDELCRVVEGPLELNVHGVGLHLAEHVHQLPLGHSVDHGLLALAHRHVYNTKRILTTNKKLVVRPNEQ